MTMPELKAKAENGNAKTRLVSPGLIDSQSGSHMIGAVPEEKPMRGASRTM